MLLESRLAQDTVMLSTLTMSSFAGLALTIVPWLLLAGRWRCISRSIRRRSSTSAVPCVSDTLVVPGPLVMQLADTGHLGHMASAMSSPSGARPSECCTRRPGPMLGRA